MDKSALCSHIDGMAQRLAAWSDAVWDCPETAFQERRSAEVLCRALEEEGFAVERGVAGIETAFLGRWGEGKPVIGFLGEFDALSGLSQQPDTFAKTPLCEGAPGHGCGHNLLGVGSLAAASAVKAYLAENHLSGTVVYYGCPGEEGGSGKAFMARDGVFDELDCALTWHPGDTNAANSASSLANYQICYRYYGVSAHAAACPHLGRSALDAVELMNIGVQFLREHIIPEARIHYAITNTGGYSPNVVQPYSEVLYLIRAPKTGQVQEIYERVGDIAKGAALMTGTRLETQFIKACSNLVPNTLLTEKLDDNLREIPLPSYTEEERAYAAAVQKSFESKSDTLMAMAQAAGAKGIAFAKEHGGRPINDFVVPNFHVEAAMPGSTDVGDVSWVCPTAQISAVTMAAGTPGHSWQLVAQGKSSIAHKGTLYAGKVLAGTAVDLIHHPEWIEAAKEELRDRLDGGHYIPPIPAGVKPSVIDPSAKR